ncbi:hypothetical protein QR680_015592 [Steinernema hermaphroditum]|uniref:Uncharacterized protein n=1 Tax=Steinernema hermaphroditum TaxID=289476 RepID=A0AA39HA82_9BILA|nr:hypothetical protein QR680_015592 [Steinernema hermaphroditum]
MTLNGKLRWVMEQLLELHPIAASGHLKPTKKELLTHSCYKFLTITSILDVTCLTNAALFSGLLTLLNLNPCNGHAWTFVFAYFAPMLWYTYCAASEVLSLNRMLFFVNDRLSNFLFKGKRTWLWLIYILSYPIICAQFHEDGMFYVYDPYSGLIYDGKVGSIKKELLTHSCYKVLTITSILDVTCLTNAALFSGLLTLLNLNPCNGHAWTFVFAYFAPMLWYTYCAASEVLSLNRMLFFVNDRLSNFLFKGKRTWLWLIYILSYPIICAQFHEDGMFYVYDPYSGLIYDGKVGSMLTMSTDFAIIIGSIFLLLSTIFVPLYARIIYLCCTDIKYKQHRSYKIMAQIGIAQLCAFPAQTLIGVIMIVGYDPLGIVSVLLKIMNSGHKADALLSVALAYERLTIICRFKEIRHFIFIIACAGWIAGGLNFAFLCSPWTDLSVNTSHFGSFLYKQLRWETAYDKLAFWYPITATGLTFMAYLAIGIQLLHQKVKTKFVNITLNEKAIFVQAFVRFIGDFTSTTMLSFALTQYNNTLELRLFIRLVYILNDLVFPPLMSIAVCRTLRRKVFTFSMKQTYRVESIEVRVPVRRCVELF